MGFLNLILKTIVVYGLISYVAVKASEGVPQKRSPKRNRLQGRPQNVVKPIQPRLPHFGNATSNDGAVYKRLGGNSQGPIIKSSSLTTTTSCGNTYILEAGQAVLVYSRHDLYAYDCETMFRPANIETTTLTMTCPDFALKFNCYFESLSVKIDGTQNVYCRNAKVPDSSGTEFTIHYKRNLNGFNGGFVCVVMAVGGESNTSPENNNQCGVTAAMEEETNDNHRVVGGQNAVENEHPWMAYLKMSVGSYNFEYRCGGSLITEKHIISAAHCFYGYHINYIDVALGKHDVTTVNEDGAIWRRATDFKLHESYDDILIMNDIAIIRLPEALTFSDTIRPICLPASDFQFANNKVTATGWGALDYEGLQANILQEVELNLQSNSDCEDDWQAKFLDDNMFIFDNQMCAIGDGKDTCSGDSGGPLIHKVGNKWVLVGITSFGYRCADPDVAGVYTRVSSYTAWINKQIADE